MCCFQTSHLIKCDVDLALYNLRGTTRFREKPQGLADRDQNYRNDKPRGFRELKHEVPRGLGPK